ncbi:MAG: hypothetical protein LIO62_06765 [Clostridiales bacterium]|nr:hypothetical protein [Clostridiales bacterium]
MNLLKLRRLKKELKKQLNAMTVRLPCVNLSVKIRLNGDFAFYNNCDFLISLSPLDAKNLLLFGNRFFYSAIYALCVKYSIDKY